MPHPEKKWNHDLTSHKSLLTHLIEKLEGEKREKGRNIGKFMPADQVLADCEDTGYNTALQETIDYLKESLKDLEANNN